MEGHVGEVLTARDQALEVGGQLERSLGEGVNTWIYHGIEVPWLSWKGVYPLGEVLFGVLEPVWSGILPLELAYSLLGEGIFMD